MNKTKAAHLSLSLCLSCATAAAADLPPLEAYGNLARVSAMALSPSGNRVAFRLVEGERDYVVVRDLASGEAISGADVGEVKPRSLNFIDERFVILQVSETRRERFGRKAFEDSGAFVLDVETHDIDWLLSRADDIHPAQTGLGRVLGKSEDGTAIYMPAFTGRTTGEYSLFRIGLDRRAARKIANGNIRTIDWFMGRDGQPVVQEEFDDIDNVHRLWALDGRDRRLIYEKETELRQIGAVGLAAGRDAIVFHGLGDGDEYWSLSQMSLADGSVTGPQFARENAGIDEVIKDVDRVVLGVRYSGFMPVYEFADEKLTARISAVQDSLSGAAAYLADWTPDFSRMLFFVTGGWSSGDYILAGRGIERPTRLAQGRPDIPSEAVVPTVVAQYQARDGLTIPALLTVQPDVASAGKVPLVVIPHGGPESYDSFRFAWLPQFLASRGYAVLQPQFRGSSGFGESFSDAGKGEWGGKMSTDLDDGVQWLIDQGVADPERVGIIGASYGGYAALAAGAYSEFDYRLVVSIAGPSDLSLMLKNRQSRYGRRSWSLDYWVGQFGSDRSREEVLAAMSPVHAAESFRAPVLLLHGDDDTVVEISQSRVMERALERADKDVTFVTLDGEDHFLSTAAMRLQALRAIDEFVGEHL